MRGYNQSLVNEKYKFSEKERDVETGFDCFGARYYDGALGIFLSCDRFSDKYPSLSPYQYAANNPLRFVDINGDSIAVEGDIETGLKDMQSTVGNDGARLSLNDKNQLVANLEGYKTGTNEVLDILVTAIGSDKIITYSADNTPISTKMLDIYGQVMGGGIENASTTHRFAGLPNESTAPHGQYPSQGDGEVKVSQNVVWSYTNNGENIPRSQIVGHEIIENINRTIDGQNYFEAHSRANNYFFGGDAQNKIKATLP